MSSEENPQVEETEVEKENATDDQKAEMPPPPPPKTDAEILKEQEVKLRAKYPGMKGGPASSSFLQKRLSKGQKYFDSGDYNMAKAKMGPKSALPQAAMGQPICPSSMGDTIPPAEAIAHRKPSIVQSRLADQLHLSQS